MTETEVLDALAYDWVDEFHNRHLIGLVRAMTGWWERDESNWIDHQLDAARFTDEQRQVVWELLTRVVADSFHGLVHQVDQELTTGRLAIAVRDPSDAKTMVPITSLPAMPMACSTLWLEASGIDPVRLYQDHLQGPKQGQRHRDGRA